MIEILSIDQALERTTKSLALPAANSNSVISEVLLAQALRRAINFMAPCAAHELSRAVTDSFRAFRDDTGELPDRVAATLESLIVFGDILEMRQVDDISLGDQEEFLLRPAPPSFVVRADGSVALLGIAGDQPTPLTAELDASIRYHGVLRIIPRISGPDMPSALNELGYFRMPEQVWLRLPASRPANEFLDEWRDLLSQQPESGPIEGLIVLDTATPPNFYKGRWGEPQRSQSGIYIVRRPRKYGSPLWCLAELDQGRLKRFKDLSVAGDRLRPFDIAWQIQASLDTLAGTPQQYHASSAGSQSTVIRFYCPLPSWCERYLSVSGQKHSADQSLFSFEFSNSDAAHEKRFIEENLWMIEVKR